MPDSAKPFRITHPDTVFVQSLKKKKINILRCFLVVIPRKAHSTGKCSNIWKAASDPQEKNQSKMVLSLPHAESRISGSLHHLLDVDHAGYPALLCNSHFKGIRADRPPAQFTNDPHGSTDLQHLTPRKQAGSDLASPGRLNQFAPGNEGNDLRLEDGSWKL